MSLYAQSPLFAEEVSLSISSGINQKEATALYDNTNTLIIYHTIQQSSVDMTIRLIFLSAGQSVTPLPADTDGGIYLFPNRYYTIPLTTGQARPGGSRVIFTLDNSSVSTGKIYVSQVLETNGG